MHGNTHSDDDGEQPDEQIYAHGVPATGLQAAIRATGGDEDDAADDLTGEYSDDELDAVDVHSAGGYYGRPRYVVRYVQNDSRGGRARKTFETEERARLVAAALVYHGRAESADEGATGGPEIIYEEDY